MLILFANFLCVLLNDNFLCVLSSHGKNTGPVTRDRVKSSEMWNETHLQLYNHISIFWKPNSTIFLKIIKCASWV